MGGRCAAVYELAKSRTGLSNWTEIIIKQYTCKWATYEESIIIRVRNYFELNDSEKNVLVNTCNAPNEIEGNIYPWINYKKKVLRPVTYILISKTNRIRIYYMMMSRK